jgi:hypothetical protein
MGRNKIIKLPPSENPNKYTRVFEDDESITTWTYNLDMFLNGPISVDIKHKTEINKPKTNGKKTKDTRRGDAVSNSNETPRTRRSRQERS